MRIIKSIYTTLVLVLFVSLTSCGDLLVTDNEAAGSMKVVEFYGGKCERSKGFNTGTDENETYFTLALSESDLVNSYAEMLELPASNVAYLFFNELKEEQANYTHVNVELSVPNQLTQEFEFSAKDLKEICQFVPRFDQISKHLKDKEYQEVLGSFSKGDQEILSPSEIDSSCTQVDSAYGEIQETQFQGFSFFENEMDGRSVVELFGINIRENMNTPFKLYLDRDTKNTLQFKFDF